MATNPNTFKQLILSKHPDGVSNDGTPYAKMSALELTKKIVEKYPEGVTSDGTPYKKFLPSIGGEILRGIIKPVSKVVASGINIGETLAGKPMTETFNSDYLGNTQRVGAGFDSNKFIGGNVAPLKDAVGTGLELGSNLVGGGGTGALVKQGFQGAVRQAVKTGVKSGAGAGALYGAGDSLQKNQGVGQTLLNTAIGGATGGIAGGVLGGVTGALFNPSKIKPSSILPKSDEIMNRVARLTPTEANKFKQMTGKSHGEYLAETGNFNDPKKIVQNEYEKFTNSIKEVDDTLATLPGEFKSSELDTVLDDLVERETKIGVPNEETARITALYNKNKSTGLSMSEMNEAKRLYERTVKLGYLKENNAIGVARSTRLDSALREWQFKTADELGFKNLRELNKQTQASKFIVDKLGKQLTGKTGNDAISLTDWVLLSGGDPTALAAFLAKKGLLNKGFQSSMAKMLYRGKTKGPIKADVNQTNRIETPLPK